MFNNTYEETVPANETGNGQTAGKKITKYLAIVAAIITVIMIVTLVLCSKGVKLKYAWGTSFDKIMNSEGDEVYRYDRNRYQYDHIEAHDKDHRIDRIKELDISSDGVSYVLRDEKLFRLAYYFTNDYSAEEVAAIVSSYYGNNYYDRGTEYIWWEDGTVVRIDMYDQRVSYFDELDYLEAGDSYSERHACEDILEYFGKERYEDSD